MNKRLKAFILVVLMVIGVFTTAPTLSVEAANCDYDFYQRNDLGYFYDPCDDVCAEGSSLSLLPNKDYRGRDILDADDLAIINDNRDVYEKAEEETGVPWEAIAVLHYRENGLARSNPDNGQGIYQDLAQVNGPYPTGPVDDEEFLRQTIWAANFLKGKSSTPNLVKRGNDEQIKDAFFGYNGRAEVYVEQAQKLGFPNPYDGSPYVMNMADALRDPEKNPTGWGQIKEDGGPIEYPATNQYGAYVIYASLSGGSTTECSSLTGDLSNRIVQLAEAEYELWSSGQLKPGNDYKKYTYDIAGDWCAWFTSWILKEAGKPVDDSDTPDWPGVRQWKEGATSLGFVFHEAGSGYKPKPGDFALYKGTTHINIIVGEENGRLISIGGNEGAGENGNFTNSAVKRNIGYANGATGYIEVR